MEKYLNIITFNIPWPANYGGVIDVFYRIKALHACGVKIILHNFVYDRPPAEELDNYCEQVFYYKRKTGLLHNISLLPYNVFSRKDPELLNNLLANDYPILFESLHSCYYLNHTLLKNRFKIYREGNIEHDYYRELGKSESNLIKKCFFYIEALRFARYQEILSAADLMITVSMKDADYLRKVYPTNKIEFIPCFHANDQISAIPGRGDFILYHAKLSVQENTKAAKFLITKIFSRLNCRCIIAGMNPPASLFKLAHPYPHIQILANPSQESMDDLIRNAQIHLLITFQDTGLKLKLLNSLFAGRFILVNSLMLAGSGLDSLCYQANTVDEMISTCEDLMGKDFTEAAIAARSSILFPAYSNKEQAIKIRELLFDRSQIAY